MNFAVLCVLITCNLTMPDGLVPTMERLTGHPKLRLIVSVECFLSLQGCACDSPDSTADCSCELVARQVQSLHSGHVPDTLINGSSEVIVVKLKFDYA